jgi:hypothetical protein
VCHIRNEKLKRLRWSWTEVEVALELERCLSFVEMALLMVIEFFAFI